MTDSSYDPSGPLLLVLGIRPDVIRASLIIARLRAALGKDFVFVWSGQHYSDNLKDVFFRQLGVEPPDIEMNVVSEREHDFIGKWIAALGSVIQERRPRGVAFLGDTNTVLGTIACAVYNVPIIHIEGCMRSYDWRMPEEKYRTVADHLSDLIYAYLDEYKEQGVLEGIDPDRIVVTGNPIVDVLEQYFLSGRIRFGTDARNALLVEYDVRDNDFFVMTSHRRENVEDPKALQNIMNLAKATVSPVVFPASYRTQRSLKSFGTHVPGNVKIVDPIGYIELLELIVASTAVLTDSGTVVEETAVLGIPSVQMRRSTERPQVYDCGSSVKFDPHREWNASDCTGVIESARSRRGRVWQHGLGDGASSTRIADDLISRMQNPESFFGHAADRPGRPFHRNLGFGLGNLGDWK